MMNPFWRIVDWITDRSISLQVKIAIGILVSAGLAFGGSILWAIAHMPIFCWVLLAGTFVVGWALWVLMKYELDNQ